MAGGVSKSPRPRMRRRTLIPVRIRVFRFRLLRRLRLLLLLLLTPNPRGIADSPLRPPTMTITRVRPPLASRLPQLPRRLLRPFRRA